jgi:hypothetical protein
LRTQAPTLGLDHHRRRFFYGCSVATEDQNGENPLIILSSWLWHLPIAGGGHTCKVFIGGTSATLSSVGGAVVLASLDRSLPPSAWLNFRHVQGKRHTSRRASREPSIYLSPQRWLEGGVMVMVWSWPTKESTRHWHVSVHLSLVAAYVSTIFNININ